MPLAYGGCRGLCIALSPLVLKPLGAGHAGGGGADADWRRFGVCADGAGTGGLYRFLRSADRRALREV